MFQSNRRSPRSPMLVALLVAGALGVAEFLGATNAAPGLASPLAPWPIQELVSLVRLGPAALVERPAEGANLHMVSEGDLEAQVLGSQSTPVPTVSPGASRGPVPRSVVINEIMPLRDGSQAPWVELVNRSDVAVSLREAMLDAGAGARYFFPGGLPDVPPAAFVVVSFDGLGSGHDDYDLSDGIATLHTGPGAPDPFRNEGGRLAFYGSSSTRGDALLDFVAWGSPPGRDADNAVAAGLWRRGSYVPTGIGDRGVLDPGESLGLFPGRSPGAVDSWAIYVPGRTTLARENNGDAPPRTASTRRTSTATR